MTAATLLPRLLRSCAGAALILAPLMSSPTQAADPAPFDLPGPGLHITVTRSGVTLPIGQVPDLEAGDKLVIRADLPEDQRIRFLLVSAFLSGATNPPPNKWIESAETWKRKDKDRLLSLTVPEGAKQMVLFLVPETGGAASTIGDAVKGKPGEFVRATQSINQASLDRSRLNAFIAAIRAQENSHPEFLKNLAPVLARSLAIKLNADCLAKVVEFQAACLLEDRETLVLADVHSSSVAETLAGAPTDLALQLSYTREGGFGYYSPYIAVVRDIARVFGAFSSPQFNYLPALSLRDGERVSLVLNSAPSFAKPKSVLVASMPAIGTDSPPRLRAVGDAPMCGANSNLVLPVEGAPLIYSTDYARNMVLRVGATDVPVQARAERGGYVFAQPLNQSGLGGTVEGRLQGFWGYQPFAGPSFTLQFPTGEAWKTGADATSLVTGRDNKLILTGSAPSCVSSVTMRVGDGTPQPVAYTTAGDKGLALTLPLKDARSGDVTLEIRQIGQAEPAAVTLRAYRQASKVSELTVHAGDRAAQLTGQRLDQVAAIQLGGLSLKPDGLTRDGDIDRLQLVGEGEPLKPGDLTARVSLSDGRTLSLPVTVRAPRIGITLLDKSVQAKDAAARQRLTAPADTLLPDSARLIFSVRASGGSLSRNDALEIAGPSGQPLRLVAGPNLQLQGQDVLVATLDPAALGPSGFGALRVRLVRDGEVSDWQPLTTLARLPKVDGVECKREACTLSGESLFLIESIAATPAFEKPVSVPQGYTGGVVKVPVPQGGKLYLKLRDAPDQVVVLNAG
ncbi:hypothetical protein [Sphingomonas xinjiangensis]|uniref:Uncharacterized protein n=1 Tax=Sphingomonas xinjiangensis TaxID=643568 RepID=A0A840YC47_9SPHN|nr:hypothetical protein [Sphingomonas xinjiangensis]MBB5710937.1 hypothetical protein [Sphingomonas xinjiangensis]